MSLVQTEYRTTVLSKFQIPPLNIFRISGEIEIQQTLMKAETFHWSNIIQKDAQSLSPASLARVSLPPQHLRELPQFM